MQQDYRALTMAQLDQLEKQTLRVLVQAVQQYSREAKDIFENTAATSKTEVIVLAEDLVQYALEVAECFPINKRFAGFIDYKRARWLSTPFGIFPQFLLVDAKASTENNRETLQQSQLPLDAEFVSEGKVVKLAAGVPPHREIAATSGKTLVAVTTSAFIHFYYEDLNATETPYRRLKAIYLMSVPHQRLKSVYNPNATKTFFGQGKHSPARQEDPRIRVYFSRLKEICPWRLQELHFPADGGNGGYAKPVWRDVDDAGAATETEFSFLGR